MNEREEAARRICARLRGAGFRALWAGGCVRDRLLGLEPKDYDIATNARVDEVGALFPRTAAVGAAFGVMLVLEPEGAFEVSTFRKDGPYLDGRHPSRVDFVDEREDALRRDFTVNALFLDPQHDRVLDYVGGLEDLHANLLRAVGDPVKRFEEDHLRLLRAVRFAARLGYAMDPATATAIRALAPLAARPSAERIRDEITKMLMEGHAGRAFRMLDDLGLLPAVLPEIAAMKGVEQPPEFHPEGDVFTHTLLMLEALHNPSLTLAYAVLLHDVGKPATQTFEDRIRFNFHDKVGARLAEEIGRRLRLSSAQIERIVWLVGQHMRLAFVPEMRESKRKRFARHEGFEELVELCRIDCLASGREAWEIDWIKAYLQQLVPEEARPRPLITGHHLIAMGFVPGALFREILSEVEDAQLDGSIHTPDEARAFVLGRWRPNRNQ